MSAIRAPGLGPLVGHTTATSCRIWIRAGDPGDDGAQLASTRRTVGVLGVVAGDRRRPRIDKAYYFRLHREFDRTGTFVLGEDVALGRHPTDIEARKQALGGRGAPKADTPYTLQPDTEYRVRVGTLTLDDPLPDAATLTDWQLADYLPPVANMATELLNLRAEDSEALFRTFPAPEQIIDRLSFLLGSCRYPGLLWKIKEADRIYGPMQIHFTGTGPAPAARFTLMVGDQIYADMLNRLVPILRADTYEEFQQRYLEAFGAPNLRQLMRSSTTYMILDDHEIEDNWTQDRLKNQGKHHLFNIAIGAYMSYQWSHGPRTWDRRLYYTFACGGYPFFVLDTRTQRFKDDAVGLRDDHMLGRPTIDPAHPGQLQRLLAWLSDQQRTRANVPKFIVTSSVFAPNPIDERIDPGLLDEPLKSRKDDADVLLYEANRERREASDSWPAYPRTRRELLEHILAHRIQNVVFLAGDIHCSNVARLWIENRNQQDQELKLYNITSSAFYWPFPFADGDPNGYVHDSKVPHQVDGFPLGDGAMLHYKSFGYTQEDNFCRLDLDRDHATLTVTVFDRTGTPVEVTDETGRKVPANTLALAPWA